MNLTRRYISYHRVILPIRSYKVTDSQHRYLMTFLSITTNKYFEASSIEVDRIGKSYTFDTVKIFKERFPDHEIYFITGADAIKEILTWHRVEELLDLCYFVANPSRL